MFRMSLVSSSNNVTLLDQISTLSIAGSNVGTNIASCITIGGFAWSCHALSLVEFTCWAPVNAPAPRYQCQMIKGTNFHVPMGPAQSLTFVFPVYHGQQWWLPGRFSKGPPLSVTDSAWWLKRHPRLKRALSPPQGARTDAVADSTGNTCEQAKDSTIYVYLHIYIYLFIYQFNIYICKYIYIYIQLNIHTLHIIYMCIYIYICLNTYICHIYIYILQIKYMYILIYVCMCIYIYMYIYIYMGV